VELAELVEQLASPDLSQRRFVSKVLVQAGTTALPALMAAICDENSLIDHQTIGQVMHRMGDAAFAPLVQVIANTDSWPVVVQAGYALTGLETSDRAMFLPLLQHPSANVRNRAAIAFEDMGAEALPYTSALLPLVADPDEGVRGRGEMALRAMGPEIFPILRAFRSSAWPHRRHALLALAEIGRWHDLDPVDHELIQRLIRIKLASEVPEPIETFHAEWYALQTNDQEAVLQAFGLSDAMPVTMRLGEEARLFDLDDFFGLAEGPGARVYVTPALDGWILVFGYPSDDAPVWAEGGSTINDATAALSARFGAAHWYTTVMEAASWCFAENGKIIRFFDDEESDKQIGPPHPAEKDFPDQEPDTLHVAARASIDLQGIGPHTRVEGHGVLALTQRGRREGAPVGVLKI
jgi:hypothetical protein